MHVLDEDPIALGRSIADSLVGTCDTLIRTHSNICAGGVETLNKRINLVACIKAWIRAQSDWGGRLHMAHNIR